MNLQDVLKFLEQLQEAVQKGNWFPPLGALIVFLFLFCAPPVSDGETGRGGLVYRQLIEFFPQENRARFGKYYRIIFWCLLLAIVLVLVYNTIPALLTLVALLIILGFLVYRKRLILSVLTKILRKLRRKLRLVLFVVLVCLILKAVLNYMLEDRTVIPDASFSYGENILVQQKPWLNKQNGEDWKDKCRDAWGFKEARDFKRFVEKCPADSEAKIYSNNNDIKQSEIRSVRLAVSIPISRDSGRGAFDSLEILRGVELAQREINTGGGIQVGNEKRLLEIGIANDGYTDSLDERKKARQAANYLVKKEDIIGIIGHFSSDATESAAYIYKKNSIVAVSPTSTAVRRPNSLFKFIHLGSDDLWLNSNIFRTSPDDYAAVQKLIKKYIRQYNAIYLSNPIRQVAIIYENDSRYSRLYKHYFQTIFESPEMSGKVINSRNSNQDNCGFRVGSANAQVKQCVQAAKNEANALLLVPSTVNAPYVNGVIRENSSKSSRLPLLGGDSMYKDRFRSEKNKGMAVIVPLERRKIDNTEFSWRAAMAYDATQALVQGIRDTSNKCSGERDMNGCLRKELQSTMMSKSFKADGILGKGTVQFKDTGDRNVTSDLEDQLGVIVCVQNQGDKYDFVKLESGSLCHN